MKELSSSVDSFDPLKPLKKNKTDLFIVIIIAYKCVFSRKSRVNPPSVPQENDLGYLEYKQWEKAFGEQIASEMYQIFFVDKNKKILKDTVKDLVNYILTNDYTALLQNYYSSRNNADFAYNKPFDKEMFFYDDDGKKYYKEYFFKKIDQFDFSKDQHIRIMCGVLKYFINDLLDDQKQLLIETVANQLDNSKLENLTTYLRLYFEKAPQEIRNIENQINTAFKNKRKQKQIDLLEKAFTNRDYVYLKDYLYQNEHKDLSVKNGILEAFFRKQFFFPDLSKEIDYDSWSYCHEIVKFVSSNLDYKPYMLDIIKNHIDHSSSKSEKERYTILIETYFGKMANLI